MSLSLPFMLRPDEDGEIVIIDTNKGVIDSSEAFAALFCIERNFLLREGYEVETNITCAKGPQHQNWQLKFTFETELGAKTAFQTLQENYDAYYMAFTGEEPRPNLGR